MGKVAEHPVLPARPTLPDVQAYIQAVVKHRGFDKETVQDQFIMLTEEVGELAKALRKSHGVAKMAQDSTTGRLDHEALDVLWMLVCVTSWAST